LLMWTGSYLIAHAEYIQEELLSQRSLMVQKQLLGTGLSNTSTWGQHSETCFLYAKNRTRRFSDRFLRHTPLFCTQKSSKYLHCSIQLVRGWLFSVKHAPTS